MRRRRTNGRRELSAAAALAALGHLLALLALGWRIPTVNQKAAVDLVPPVEVTLLRPKKPIRPEAPAPARSQAAAQPPPPATPEPPAAAPAPSPSVLTQPSPVEAEPPNGGPFRSALRGLIGCSDPSAYRLDREERARCDQRLASATPAPVTSRLSPQELAALDPPPKENIFTRKPHNECLPHIGDRPAKGAVASRSGQTTAFGIACEWSFW